MIGAANYRELARLGRDEQVGAVLDAENAKYGTGYSIETLDPAETHLLAVRPLGWR